MRARSAQSTTPDPTRRRDLGVRLALAGVLTVSGILGLGATALHRGEYPGSTPLAIDLLLFATLALSGLGLLRRRRWAARVATLVLYLAFLAVLATLSLTYDSARHEWWYWMLPLALPLLGYAVKSLRRQRTAWQGRW